MASKPPTRRPSLRQELCNERRPALCVLAAACDRARLPGCLQRRHQLRHDRIRTRHSTRRRQPARSRSAPPARSATNSTCSPCAIRRSKTCAAPRARREAQGDYAGAQARCWRRPLLLTPDDPDLLQWQAELALVARDWARAEQLATRSSRRARSSAACAGATGPRSASPREARGDAAAAAQAQQRVAGLHGRRRRSRDVADGRPGRSHAAPRWRADGPLAEKLPGYVRARGAAARWPQAVADAIEATRDPDRRSRHRHRQDLRLPRAGAAVGPARDHLHRHARAAGPALPSRPAAGARRARREPQDGAAQGPLQLPVPVPHGAGQGRALRQSRGRRAVPARRRLERAQPTRRPGRTAGTARRQPAAAAGDFHRRQLPRQRVPVLVRVLRGRRRAPRRRPPTSSWSTTTCCSPTWRSSAKASAKSCRAPRPSCSTRRTSCRNWPRSSSATASARGSCWNWRAMRWPKRASVPGALATVQQPMRSLEHAVRELRLAMNDFRSAAALRACSRIPARRPRWPRWRPALRNCCAGLAPLAETSPGFAACADRARCRARRGCAAGATARRWTTTCAGTS